jgi:hypothetical protein
MRRNGEMHERDKGTAECGRGMMVGWTNKSNGKGMWEKKRTYGMKGIKDRGVRDEDTK